MGSVESDTESYYEEKDRLDDRCEAMENELDDDFIPDVDRAYGLLCKIYYEMKSDIKKSGLDPDNIKGIFEMVSNSISALE